MEFSLEQLDAVSESLVADLVKNASRDHATVVTFSGDLGAGKTTLIQSLARKIGVAEDLQSPTFVIYKIYHVSSGPADSMPAVPFKHVVHGDMYRLESSDEIRDLGWGQLVLDPENILFIEWPEKIADIVPPWATRIALAHQDGGASRIVTVENS